MEEETPVTHRIDDKEPTYESIKQMVGGYIEVAFDDGNTQIICNEEGKIHGLPVNQEATKEWSKLLGKNSFYEMPDILVGDCVILTGEALLK
jgi:hypothetical protein